jgi:hypothetical protein
MRLVALVFIGLAACTTLQAVTLCIENSAKLDGMTLKAAQNELQGILVESRLSVTMAGCDGAKIRVQLVSLPLEPDSSALGASRIELGRITPDLAVFVNPIRRLIGTSLPHPLGKALARVAAHEVGHYLKQTSHHAEAGAMTEYFSGPRLLAGTRTDFRIR